MRVLESINHQWDKSLHNGIKTIKIDWHSAKMMQHVSTYLYVLTYTFTDTLSVELLLSKRIENILR